jgi:hypothetical protein
MSARVTTEETRRVGDALRVNWSVVPEASFKRALETELEHTDVTHGDLLATGQIALAHLRETPDYYERLAPMEAAAAEYWATRAKPSPTLGGGWGCKALLLIVALLAVLLAILIVGAARARKQRQRRDGFPPVQSAMGYRIALPGNPYENVLRRSNPLPPRKGRAGGLADFYFNYDPAHASWFGGDYCEREPHACGGFAIEPFRPV